jgi:SAM-dependent methyltransferase
MNILVEAGTRTLEIGCGSGYGSQLVLERFGAATVDAVDLDPAMIRRAGRRLARYGDRVSSITVADHIATAYRTSTTGPPIAITMCRDIRLRLSQIPGTHKISVMGGYPLQPNSGRHSRRLLPLLDRVSRR